MSPYTEKLVEATAANVPTRPSPHQNHAEQYVVEHIVVENSTEAKSHELKAKKYCTLR